MLSLIPLFVLLVIFASVVVPCIKVLQEYERAVIFRLGRFVGVRGPGLIILVPALERMVRVNLRTLVMDVPSQDTITKDNISIKVNAVIYFRVVVPEKSVLEVDDAYYATSQIAQTTLRSIIGQFDLDDLLSHRDKINMELQTVIDKQTDPWGVKIGSVEMKHIDLPQEMQRAMAKQAEAERDRRAKVINADGEYQAATKLAEASNIMENNPITLQLRYLQTLSDISSKEGSTTIIPIPLDIFQTITSKATGK
ncbi:slipin family protein [Deferribacterales bacterium RsTz2092]|nr:membrane protein [Deferribacterales bacterium]